jgi:GntR family transcriptional regulator
MILKLNMSSETPIYVQLRNQIVLGIGRGELQLGEGLPTVRQLAGRRRQYDDSQQGLYRT